MEDHRIPVDLDHLLVEAEVDKLAYLINLLGDIIGYLREDPFLVVLVAAVDRVAYHRMDSIHLLVVLVL